MTLPKSERLIEHYDAIFGSSCPTLETEEKHMDFAFHFH